MIGFAHRGAPAAGVRENSLDAFTQALARGARALESDVWLTADGVPVLVHDELLRSGLRRHPIRELPSTRLPKWLPALDTLYSATGGDFDLSLDVKDGAAGAPVLELAEKHGASGGLWLCGSAGQVRGWKPAAGDANLVVSTTLKVRGQERSQAEGRIDEAAEAGARAFNLRAPEWSAGRVRRCHDQQLLAFAWDVQRPANLAKLRDLGCDAIYSDSVPLAVTA